MVLVQTYPLSDLRWAGHRVSAIAALMILICLAVRLNLSRRENELEEGPGNRVRMTYTDIEQLTGYARPTISKAISLLEALGAVRVKKEGRANVYELVGVDQRGGWCQLPQGHLADGAKTGELKRLTKIHNNRLTLEALKLYVLLLTFRDQKQNTTSIGYEAIMKYTGMRREDVPKAAAMLVALDLIGASEGADARPEDRSKRYTVKGLKAF
jgi:DNA-binding transcriptional ArsR family regulator